MAKTHGRIIQDSVDALRRAGVLVTPAYLLAGINKLADQRDGAQDAREQADNRASALETELASAREELNRRPTYEQFQKAIADGNTTRDRLEKRLTNALAAAEALAESVVHANRAADFYRAAKQESAR